MRTNLPITNHEVELRPDDHICSKTDLKGRITYINKDFLDISGYTEAELLGEPHNIIRHPDMPEEAFADLWRCLKAGRPWIAIVKNRCKNGDHYWVEAHATPIYEEGKVSGYMSTRRKATRAQIDAASNAYAKFKTGNAQGLSIENGAVVASNPLGRMKRAVQNLSLKARITSLLLFLFLIMFVIAAEGLLGSAKDREAMTHIREQRFATSITLAKIVELMATGRSELIIAFFHDPTSRFAITHAHPITKHTDAVIQTNQDIDKLFNEYATHVHSEQHQALFEKFKNARNKYSEEGLVPAIGLLKQGKYDEAMNVRRNQVDTGYQTARAASHDLLSYLSSKADSEYQQMVDDANKQRNLFIGMLVGSAILVWVLGAALLRAIIRPLDVARGAFMNISQGRYDTSLNVARNDELGKVLQGLEAMQSRMGLEVVESKRQADEMARIKIALDNVTTGVMIADAERNIIYTNPSIVKLLTKAEPEIRKKVPSFNANKLAGTKIDALDNSAGNQSASSTQTAELKMGDQHLVVVTNPVVTPQGERLGSVAEWVDRTAEVNAEEEVENIITQAARGNFEARLITHGKEGFFLKLSLGLNQLSEVVSTGLNDIAIALKAIAKGDLTRKIDRQYEGLFGQLKEDTNTTVDKLKEVVGQIKDASEAINTAAKEIAAGNSDLSSRTEEQASSLEETASSMEELSATVKQNADSAREANDLAQQSNHAVTRGGESVQRVVSTMNDIQSSSKKIADIIGVIDSIAFQTNILALNAAVEAARAGEQGRGFAVVASEVRNLAQRSATAAKEIKELIAESVGKVDDGAHLVEEAGQTIQEVVASFGNVAKLVTDIAGASREQSGGIEQVSKAIGQMDEVTQQNAALVEQAAAAAESLEEQARQLVQAVSIFTLNEQRNFAHKASSKPILKSTTPNKSSLPTKTVKSKSVDEEWESF